ncbi:DUF3820 family protein [Verrucomicrobiales bacterium]|jgi:uncharacterized protein (DUF3820 family)|nr:DUF3820 family protein [Verrucomicrobiales bacterium]MDB2497274.1 DUF3820 family protein [Verrucomicrobiales bacterium]MDB2642535.1 DUF3820 family protein [bacterium]MDC0262791.1 DUF3820 family protein [Verrucomicrobiales bacterium]
MSESEEHIDPGEAMKRELADNLADLEIYRMPFGRYQQRKLHTLPYEYLHWFIEKGGGFPSGRLGELMEFVYHIKASGSEEIFARLGRG